VTDHDPGHGADHEHGPATHTHAKPPWWPEDEPWPPSGWGAPFGGPGARRRARRRARIAAAAASASAGSSPHASGTTEPGSSGSEWGGWPGWRRGFGCLVVLFATFVVSVGVVVLWVLSTLFGRGPANGALANLARPASLIVLIVGIAALAIGIRLARRVGRPLSELVDAANRIEAADYSVRVAEEPQGGSDLRGLSRAFNSMAERLESMVKAQQRLLGDISHELRSPLARLGVALGLARQRSGAEANGALDRIERESDNLNEMISQLLTLTRLETGTDGRKRTDVDLAALVKEVADDADFEARSLNRAVQVVSSDNCSIKGVEELLRSAVENVVRNAVRYTPEGSAVEVALTRQNGHAVISVRDRGHGVPEEALEKIFRPFYRTEDARDRQSGGGTGLGLAITERAVRMHGGSVQAVNAADGGLTVEMKFRQDSQDFSGFT